MKAKNPVIFYRGACKNCYHNAEEIPVFMEPKYVQNGTKLTFNKTEFIAVCPSCGFGMVIQPEMVELPF